jgi:hypothetical protein
MPFEDSGFLDRESWPVINAHAKDAAGPLMQWVEDLCEFSWRHQFELASKAGDTVAEMRMCLYAKVVSTAQGAMILLHLGMAQQGEALARVALEAMFALGAITKDNDVAKSLVAGYHDSRIKRINRVLQSTSEPLKGALSDKLARDVIAESRAAIKELEVASRNVEQLARTAGLHDLYVVLYSSLSDAVHSTVQDMENHIVHHNGEATGFRNEPDFERIGSVATIVAQTVIAALAITAHDTSSNAVAPFIEDARKKLHELGDFSLGRPASSADQ